MFVSLALIASFFVLARGESVPSSQYACLARGNYNLCNNQWNIGAGTGSQAATMISTSGNDISWSTNYTWAGNENTVKTYTNVESTTAKGMKLSQITSAPTTWSWDYSTESSDLNADVTYDIWFGTTPDGLQASSTSSFEIMIMLSRVGSLQPFGSLSTSGVSIAGCNWNVWKGNQGWETITFVTEDGADIHDFSADLNEFFTWLTDNEGVSPSLYLQVLEAGTEPLSGSAEFLTHSYSVDVTTA